MRKDELLGLKEGDKMRAIYSGTEGIVKGVKKDKKGIIVDMQIDGTWSPRTKEGIYHINEIDMLNWEKIND